MADARLMGCPPCRATPAGDDRRGHTERITERDMSPVSYRKPTPPWNGISPLRERHHRRGDRRATGGQTVHQNQATPATTRRVDRRTRRRPRHARTCAARKLDRLLFRALRRIPAYPDL